MKPLTCHALFRLMLITSIVSLCTVFAHAGEKMNLGGWEKNSSYNRLYDPTELDSFKGEVVDIQEIIPMKGMQPGIALIIKESDEEPIIVHLCPSWYAGKDAIGIKKGDRVKVKGVWVEIEGKDVFMASKIKKGDYFEMKVRLTKDGTPFWTITPEEREKIQDE